MSRGGVKSWAEMAGDVGKNSAVDGERARVPAGTLAQSVPLDDLIANPYNPRDALGDLTELASIADRQLQPAVVVTRAAFLGLFPDAAVTAKWVVVIGNRRLAAAAKFGRPTLDIIVKDDLAADRATLLSAVISENVDRKGFDVIEEAKAVEALVAECGTAEAAKDSLKKSSTWITQRRALLKLDPKLQDALRRGDLAIRDARELAKVPPQEQVELWLGRAGSGGGGAGEPGGKTGGGQGGPPRARSLARALRRFDTDPRALATALHDELGDDRLRTLVRLLRKQLQP